MTTTELHADAATHATPTAPPQPATAHQAPLPPLLRLAPIAADGDRVDYREDNTR